MSKDEVTGTDAKAFDDDHGAVVSDESGAVDDTTLEKMIDGLDSNPLDIQEPEEDTDEIEVVEDSEEAEPESEEESGEEAAEEVESAEDADADEPDEKPVTREDLLALQLEQYRTQAEHFRTAHDKLAGKYGELKKQLDREAERRITNARTDEADGYDGEPASPRHGTRLEREVEELRQYQRQLQLDRATQTLAAEAEAFGTEHPEVKSDEKYRAGMEAALQSRASLVQQALESSDPDVVRRATRYALTDAYMEVKAKILEEQISRKSVDQAADLKKRKKASRVSSSTATKSSKTKTYKTIDELPDDELAALIDAMG